MAKGNTPGDIVAERIKSRARLTGQPVLALLKRYVLERALYRLVEAYGLGIMLKGSMVAVIDDPETARAAPDIDVHLKAMEDIEKIVPDLLTRTYYDSNSATGLLEDHVRFTSIRVVPLQHSEGAGVKFKIEAMLGATRVNVAIDFGFGHGSMSALEVKKFPAMFKGLPGVLVSCQPAADAIADKIRAMADFGMDNTRVKDLHDVCFRIRNGTFDAEAVARSLAMSGAEFESSPVCVTPEYAAAHEATWQAWLVKAGLKDSRTLAEVVAEIRQPVEAATRAAARLRERARQPALRLVASR